MQSATDTYVITFGQWQAVISSSGAWLESLTYNDERILYDRQTLLTPAGHEKVRGGCHVCLPNFGPDASGRLAQHGFARDSEWLVDKMHADHILLKLDIDQGDYRGLQAQLEYQLSSTGITMRLKVHNYGMSKFKVAPGFHPYFNCSADSFKIAGDAYSRKNISDPLQPTLPEIVTLEIDDNTFELRAAGMGEWVVWSDNLDGYICVEPTQSEFSFNQLGRPKAATIVPQQEVKYEFTVQRRR